MGEEHSKNPSIVWAPTNKGVHCKVTNAATCKIEGEAGSATHNCNCECHVQDDEGPLGPLITPAQGNAHDITGYDSPHGDAQVYHSITDINGNTVKEQKIVPQKKTNNKDKTASAKRVENRNDIVRDTLN